MTSPLVLLGCQVVKGGDATPFMISPTAALSRSPGTGTMTCCARDHVEIGAEGGLTPMPCRRDSMAPIMVRMLRFRREYHLGGDDMINFRWWTALVPTVMKGLPSDGVDLSPQSVNGFLHQNRFKTPQDETRSSGFTPIIFAAFSGNSAVVNELLTRHSAVVDVNARVLVDLPKYGFEKGMDALTFAACGCPQDKVYEIVSLLLAHGADPNSTTWNSGGTPLMAAIIWHNIGGVQALIASAGTRLDLEKGIKANSATGRRSLYLHFEHDRLLEVVLPFSKSHSAVSRWKHQYV